MCMGTFLASKKKGYNKTIDTVEGTNVEKVRVMMMRMGILMRMKCTVGNEK